MRRTTFRWAKLAVTLLFAGCAVLACRSQPAEIVSSGERAGAESSGKLGVKVVVAPAGVAIVPFVRDERIRALTAGRRLLVYVGATWCEPCQRFRQAAERGDLDTSFPGLTFLEFDEDRDGARLSQAGYASEYIPLIAIPNEDGTGSGKQIEGGIKGPGAVDVISEKLRTLLQQY
jgi:thiol-disulfide isomerase/thioredoxin